MRLGVKGKKALSIAKKGVVVAGALGTIFGAKNTHGQYKSDVKDIRDDNRATLMASFNANPQISPLREGQVVGEAGRRVEAARSAPAPRTLPPSAPPIAPFNARQAGVRAAAGVVGGQIGVGEAVRDVAADAFAAQGGRRGQDPRRDALARAGRDAQAGATVAAGAEGIQASNRELAGQLARGVRARGARLIPSVPSVPRIRGRRG
jgi:hypothetical protein